MTFYDSLTFKKKKKKKKKICVEKVVGELDLALQHHFPEFKLAHLAVFDMVFPFLAFFKGALSRYLATL